MERTYIMLKPGVLQRRHMGEIISRIEKKGFKISAMKMIKLKSSLIREHYKEHVQKEWFTHLEEFTLRGPLLALVVEGPRAVSLMRKLCGATFVDNAEPGTIRGDFAMGSINPNNVIHASDSPESAEREIKIFFNENEIFQWDDPLEGWV